MADKGPPFVEGRDRVAGIVVAMHQTATRGCAGSVITVPWLKLSSIVHPTFLL